MEKSTSVKGGKFAPLAPKLTMSKKGGVVATSNGRNGSVPAAAMGKVVTGMNPLGLMAAVACDSKPQPNQIKAKPPPKKPSPRRSKNAVPGQMDIILTRGRPAKERHEGNERYQRIVYSYIALYDQCQTKKEKQNLTKSILVQVQKDGARMYRKDKASKSGWHQLSDEEARQRVGHTLRSFGAGSRVKKPYSATSKAAQKPRTPVRLNYIPYTGPPLIGHDLKSIPAPGTRPYGHLIPKVSPPKADAPKHESWGSSLWTSLKSNVMSIFRWRNE